MKFQVKLNRQKLVSRIVILTVLVLMANYLVILSEFSGIVYATFLSEQQINFDNQNNTINNNEKNIVKENNSVEGIQSDNNINLNEQEEEKLQDYEKNKEDNIIDEQQPQESVIEDNNSGSIEDIEEVNQINSEVDSINEVLEEELISKVEIINAYNYNSGVIVKAKISSTINNIAGKLDSIQTVIKAPEIDGYVVKSVIINEVVLDREDLDYTTGIIENDIIVNMADKKEKIETTNEENNTISQEIVDEETPIVEEQLENQIQENLDQENVDEFFESSQKECVVTYILEGSGSIEKFKINLKESLYYKKLATVDLNQDAETNFVTEEKISNEYTASTLNNSIYKGYLYANAISTLGYETNYSSIDKIKINSLNHISDINVTEKANKIVTKFGEEIILQNHTYYRNSSISIEQFINILGEDGYIDVYSNGTAIGRIDKNTETEENRFVFRYPEEIINVEFHLKNIKNTGDLEILNQKVIKKTANFSRVDIVNFKEIVTDIEIAELTKLNEEELVLSRENTSVSVELKDTESKVDFTMNTTNLSTIEKNLVTMNVTLKTNEEKYELFQNPVVEIELPTAVIEAEIRNVNVMYKNGLTLNEWRVEEIDTGNKVIRISLTGVQNEYKTDATIDGTTIIINADLGLDRITATGKGTVKVRYTSDSASNIAYELEGLDCEDYEVNYVSKSGILKETKLENYDDTNTSLSTYEDNTVIKGELSSANTPKTATISTVVMNNYNESVRKVEVVGLLGYEGNQKNGNGLNTTFNTTLTGPVVTHGLIGKIYYTTDENVDSENSNWTEEVENYEEVKAFKIEVENEEVKHGEKIEVNYDVNIPGEVGYNETSYNLLSTYYNLNEERIEDTSVIGLESEKRDTSLEDAQTVEEGEKLKVGIQALRAGTPLEEGEDVNEGQILRYNVTVQNTSNEEIKNLNIKGNAEGANQYWWYTYEIPSSTDGEIVTTGEFKEDTTGEHPYDEETIESLLPGETKTFTYQVIVKQTESKEVYGKVVIWSDDIEEKEYNSIKNKVVDAKIQLELTNFGKEDVRYMDLNRNGDYYLTGKVKNITDSKLENVKVDFILPNNLKYNSEMTPKVNALIDFQMVETNTSTGSIVTYTIPSIEGGKELSFNLVTIIQEGSLDVLSESATVSMKSNFEEQCYYSNEYTRNFVISKTKYNVEYTSNLPNGSKVEDGNNIIYKLKIKNIGLVKTEFRLRDYIPYGLELNSAEKICSDGTRQKIQYLEEDKILIFDQEFEVNEEITIELNTTVNASDLRALQTTIINECKFLSGDSINDIEDIVFYIDNDTYRTQDMGKPTINNNNDSNVEDNNPNEDDSNNDYVELPTLEEPKKINNNTQNNVSSNTNTEKPNNTPSKPVVENTSNNTSNNTSSNVKKQKYLISGMAWIDVDRDGLYKNDKKLSDVNVYLYLANGNNATSIDDSKLVKKTITNGNGEYAFADIESGSYIVVFDYDNDKYQVTTYQKNGVSSNTSSDVVDKKLTLNGVTKNYAVSDVLEINDKSISNIHMGLKENLNFDMSIKTYIKKVTVTNKAGTESTEYKEDNGLVKTEIKAKYLDGSKVEVEYIIKVTNEGDLAGYINQIENVIPDGFEVSKSANWTVGDDGNLYNSSLNKTKIEPNKSKEITLTLTKTMSSKNTGSYKNLAKIINSTNDLQIKDSNKDNDESTVEILILVKTGAVYYVLAIVISLAIAYIAMLAVSKKIKDNKEKEIKINKIIVIVSIMIIVMLCFIINVFAQDFIQDNTSMRVNVSALPAKPIGNYNDDNAKDCLYWKDKWYGLGTVTNMEYLSCRLWTSTDDFLVWGFDYGDYVIKPITDTYEETSNRSALFACLQCLHGTNIGWGDSAYCKVQSIINMNGSELNANGIDASNFDYTTKYIMGQMAYYGKYLSDADYSNPTGNQSDNKHALRWLIHQNSGTNCYVWYNIFGTGLSTVAVGDYDIVKGIALGGQGSAVAYASKLANGQINDTAEKLNENTVDMLKYDSTIKGYGPVHVKIPQDNIEVKITWRDKNGSNRSAQVTKLLNSSGQEVSLVGSNINDKQVYIPKDFFKDIKVEYATITFSGSCNVIRSRCVGAFTGFGTNQSYAVLRGKEENKSDSVSYVVEVRRYGATLDKNLYTIDKKVVTSFNTSKGLRDKSKKEYADKGDEVVFRYDVANIGVATNLRSIEIKDDVPNGLQIMSIGDSPNSTSSSNWNLSGDVIALKSGKKIEPEQKFTFYVKYKVTREITSNNIALTNKVYFRDVWGDDSEHVYRQNSYRGTPTVNEMDEGYFNSEDTVYTKTYKYVVKKDIQKITDAKGANVEFTTPTKSTEVGDIVTYQIKISSAKQDEGGKKYGDVNFEIKDELPSDFDFVGLKTTGAINVTQNGNTITGKGTLSPENNKIEAEILIEMRVPERLLDIKPKTVSNTSKSEKDKIINKNKEKIPEGTNGSKFESKVDVIVKGYKWTFEKVIDSVKTSHDKEVKATKAYPEGETDIVELGDIITYKITVTNTGDNSLEYGALCNVNVEDLFNEEYLEYLPEGEQDYGDGWRKTGNYTYEYGDRIKTRPDKNIAELYIKMKVIYLNYDKEVKITNNANIIKIDNRNDIDLQSLPNKQEDKVDCYEQVYAMGFKKNIVQRYSAAQERDFDATKPNGTSYVNVSGKNERIELTDEEKYDNPIEVEQGDIVTYEIKINNPSQFTNKSGNTYKQTTNLRQLEITDTLEQGITFLDAVITKNDGTNITGCVDINCTNNVTGDNTLIFKYKDDTGSNYLSPSYTISPGEYIIISYECEVTRTNMHLQNLKNVAVMTSIQNRNDYDLESPQLDRMLNDEYLQEPPHEKYNEDYIRLKNLIISGTVWEAENEGIEFSTDADRIEDIIVNLYDATNKKVASVRTDSNGYYEFDTSHGLVYDTEKGYNGIKDKVIEYDPTQSGGNHADKLMIEGAKDNVGDSNVGRIIKGTNRNDATGNYDDTSEHINYYIEFRYNGIKYNSIPRYSGSSNISNKDVTNEIKDNYKIDSNAREYTDLRRKFNEDHETIAYKTSINRSSGDKTPIIFDKTEKPHESNYQWTKETTMNAYSFTVAENYDSSLRDDGDLGRDGEANPNIDMLFFGRNENETDNVKTEYLKYINLGLVKRASLDLSLQKDVTFAQVRVNGDTLDYDYGQVDDGDEYIRKVTTSSGNTREGVYGLFIYKSDFYYRYYMYENEQVRQAKGEDSELQIDLNYKITIKNQTEGTREEDKTYVRINEVLDYYTDKMLIDKDGAYVLYIGADGGQKRAERLDPSDIASNDDTNPDGKIDSFPISNTSATTFNNTSEDAYKIDGYRTAFIKGLDEFVLENGESLELYIRYKIDKKDVQVTAPINEEDGNILKRVLELGEKMNVAQISAYSTYEANGSPKGLIDIDSNAGNVLSKDDKNDHYNLLNTIDIKGDGNQNISVKIGATDRYEDNTFRIRLDIQLKGNNIDPPGDSTYVEAPPDVEDPPWDSPPDNPIWTPPGTPGDKPGTPPTTPPNTNTVERSISGFVWEDARSEKISDAITNTKLNQFAGNGIYNESDNRNADLNAWYKSEVDEYGHKRADPKVCNSDNNYTQDRNDDIPLKDIKVEMVQLIDVDGITYEEIVDFKTLQAVLEATDTQDFKGFKRFAEGVTLTNNKGEYQLQGFLPGKYVIRFRYGDTYKDVELTKADLETLQKGKINPKDYLTSDSLVHNGQDYKSTTYGTKSNGKLVENDGETKNRDKLIALMTADADGSGKQKIVSDARDNELRRIEIMENTEEMNGKVAYDMNYMNYNTYKSDGSIDKKAKEIWESTDSSYENEKKRISEFIEATKCFADTVEVQFYIEDEIDENIRKLNENKTVTDIEDSVVKRADYHVKYDPSTEEIDGGGFSDLTITVPNVDFGISYRPENFVKLEKSIKSIKVETSSGNVLVDIEYDIDGRMKKEIGAINMQAINTIKNSSATQGFRYINIDEDLMQGSTITIDYYAKVTNIGETDTVGRMLHQKYEDEKGKAREVLEKLDAIQNNNFSSGARYAFSRLKKVFETAYPTEISDYKYGDFLGDAYYKKREDITSWDNTFVAPITVERILEWVDNDATFVSDNNKEKNRFWISTTEHDLVDNNLINAEGVAWNGTKVKPVTKKLLVEMDDNGKYFWYLDENDRKYTTNTKQNLAINVDTNSENPDLVKTIYPKISKLYTDEKSEGVITIRTNSVLSAGDHDDNEMSYEAVAEIVQIDTVTGRRTNFASAVGNLALVDGDRPFKKGTKEPDSSSTEVIKLTPPTGLNKAHLMIAHNMRIIETVVLIIAIALGGTFSFIYLKNRKKFYK